MARGGDAGGLARISHRPLAVSCERASGRDQDLRRAPAWVLWLLGRATECSGGIADATFPAGKRAWRAPRTPGGARTESAEEPTGSA